MQKSMLFKELIRSVRRSFFLVLVVVFIFLFPPVNLLQTVVSGVLTAEEPVAGEQVPRVQENHVQYSYFTYLGGSEGDVIIDFSVGSTGDVFVVGRTLSRDFPVVNAFQSEYAGGFYDFFVARIDTGAGELVFSTYFGGSDWESYIQLALGKDDTLYIVADTRSTDFPTKQALRDTAAGGYELIFAKIAPDGTLIFSTYLGGNGNDWAQGIGFDAGGNLWLTGYTESTDFPTTAGALHEMTLGGRDIFLTRMNRHGDAILYSTYLGGTGQDAAHALLIDEQGSIFLTGNTRSEDFAGTALKGAAVYVAELEHAGETVSLDTVVIVDGDGNDSANSLADAGDYLFFSGSAAGGLPVTSGAIQKDYTGGGRDGMLGAIYKPTGKIAYLSYMGVEEYDFLTDIAVRVVTSANSGASRLSGPVMAVARDSREEPLSNIWLEVFVARSVSDVEEVGAIIRLQLFISIAQDLLSGRLDPTLSYYEVFFTRLFLLAQNVLAFAGDTKAPDMPVTEKAIVSSLPGRYAGMLGIAGLDLKSSEFLNVEKRLLDAGERFWVGDKLFFEIRVWNPGLTVVRDIEIVDDLDIFLSASETKSLPPDCKVEITKDFLFLHEKITCTIAELGPGEEKVIPFSAFVTKARPEYRNHVEARTASGVVVKDSTRSVEFRENFFEAMMFRMGAKEAENGNFLAAATLPDRIDIYVDSVRVADDLQPGSGVRISVPVRRAQPRFDIVDGTEADNSNPLSSFSFDFIVGDSAEAHFSASNLFLITEVNSDSMALHMKSDARFAA